MHVIAAKKGTVGIALIVAMFLGRTVSAIASERQTVLRADRPVFEGWPPDAATEAQKLTIGLLSRNVCVMDPSRNVEFAFTPKPPGALLFYVAALKTTDPPDRVLITMRDQIERRVFETMIPIRADRWTRIHVPLEDTSLESCQVTLQPSNLDDGDALVVSEPEWIPTARVTDRPSVILISLDTLRADHLSAYGYDRLTSPLLDRFAASRCVIYRRAFANAPWTMPSHMSMLTGYVPSVHRVNRGFEHLRRWAAGKESPYRVLPTSIATLAERLRAENYLTGAFARLQPEVGFMRGFNLFCREQSLTTDLSAVLDWIRMRRDAPYFLFLHTYEIHAPYLRTDFLPECADGSTVDAASASLAAVKEYHRYPKVLRKYGLYNRAACAALYDGGIAYTDKCLYRLFRFLEQEKLLENTLVIITSDHGEEFADHDPEHLYGEHGRSLYQEILHVPLIVHYPAHRGAGKVVDANVSLVDVLPTVLRELGIDLPETIQGQALQDAVDNPRAGAARAILSECTAAGNEQKAVIQGRYKYVVELLDENELKEATLDDLVAERLFDLVSDPKEQVNLISQQPDVAARLRALLGRMLDSADTIVSETDSTTAPAISEESLRELRALGYAD